MIFLKSRIFTFLLGFLLSGLLSFYGIRNIKSHFYISNIHDSVYKYEMAIKQDSKEEIIKRLNASISCAVNGYEEDIRLGLSSRADDSYSHILKKAYALRELPCEYPFSEGLN